MISLEKIQSMSYACVNKRLQLRILVYDRVSMTVAAEFITVTVLRLSSTELVHWLALIVLYCCVFYIFVFFETCQWLVACTHKVFLFKTLRWLCIEALWLGLSNPDACSRIIALYSLLAFGWPSFFPGFSNDLWKKWRPRQRDLGHSSPFMLRKFNEVKILRSDKSTSWCFSWKTYFACLNIGIVNGPKKNSNSTQFI